MHISAVWETKQTEKIMMKINEFIKDNLKVTYPADEYSSLKLKDMMTTSRLPHIVCEDGFSMSVQVGYSLYLSLIHI